MSYRRTATGRLMVVALLSALALPACSFFRDLDDVGLTWRPPADDAGDAGGVGDSGDVGDPGTDGGDAGDVGVALPDASRFGDPQSNVCNRFDKPCREAYFCALSYNAPAYQITCRPNDHAGTGAAGEACEELRGDCMAGLDCIDWTDPEVVPAADPRGKVCTPPCLIGADEGCAPGDVCVHLFSEIPGIGYCAPGCDPYADDCTFGQCSVDPSFPDRSLLPRFRCLVHGGGDQKSAGSPCDPVLTDSNGCPSGLVCYETEADTGRYSCVAPCQADADCEAGTCQPAQGDYGLRYCTLD